MNDDFSLRYPKLYLPGQLNLLFNKKVFAQSIAEGVISSLVLFFIPYGTFYNALRQDGLDVSDHETLATVISAALIFVVTLRVSGFPLCLVFCVVMIIIIIKRSFLRHHNMKSYSRAPAFEMNGKEKMVHQKT